VKVIIWIGMVARRTLPAEKIAKEVERLANEGLIGRVSFQTGRTRLAGRQAIRWLGRRLLGNRPDVQCGDK